MNHMRGCFFASP